MTSQLVIFNDYWPLNLILLGNLSELFVEKKFFNNKTAGKGMEKRKEIDMSSNR